MNLINNKLFSVFVLLAVFNIVDACQEQAKMTPQEMLSQGVQNNNDDLVQQAIKEGVDIDIKYDNGNTALIVGSLFVGRGDAIIKLLLDAGANPDIIDYHGYTALIWATINEELEIVKLLLAKSANSNIKNEDGNTALMLAVEYHRIEIIKLLLDAGADLAIKDNENDTALDIAEKKDFVEIAKMIRDEAERRRQPIKKEVVEHLPNVLADLISEYVVSCPKIKQENS